MFEKFSTCCTFVDLYSLQDLEGVYLRLSLCHNMDLVQVELKVEGSLEPGSALASNSTPVPVDSSPRPRKSSSRRSNAKMKSSARSRRKNQADHVTCSVCQMTFTFASNLHRHMKNVHKRVEVCTEENCEYLCSSKRQLLLHTEQEHRPNIEREELTFRNIEEFYRWKLTEEVQNFVCYTKRRGDIEMVSSHHEFYICYLNRRTSVSKQLKKTESVCPSRILLKESKKDGRVTVTYYKTHSHNLTFSASQNLPMPDHLRHNIKEKLKCGLSVGEVESELRREHQSDLAVSIAIYNRLQKFDKVQISMIERAMTRKGLLGKKRNTKAVNKEHTDALRNQGIVAVIDGEIVNDGEVQMDIEPGTGFGEDFLLPGNTMEEPKPIPMPFMTEHYSSYRAKKLVFDMSNVMENSSQALLDHIDSPVLEESGASDVRQSDGDKGVQLSPKLRGLLAEVILLLGNDSIKEENLKLVEKGVENLFDICKEST